MPSFNNLQHVAFTVYAGYLNPEQCVAAYQNMAEFYHTPMFFNETVVSWDEVKPTDSDFIAGPLLYRLRTDKDRIAYTKKIVLSVG